MNQFFRLKNPANPSIADPSNHIAAGTGTGEALPFSNEGAGTTTTGLETGGITGVVLGGATSIVASTATGVTGATDETLIRKAKAD
jgi:hypothetical protein